MSNTLKPVTVILNGVLLIAVLVVLSQVDDQMFAANRQHLLLWVFSLAAPASTLAYVFLGQTKRQSHP